MMSTKRKNGFLTKRRNTEFYDREHPKYFSFLWIAQEGKVCYDQNAASLSFKRKNPKA